MSETILVQEHETWTEISLNRPDRLNSFNDEMHLAFREALEAASNSSNCRAVLLTGSGRGFCAGQDLGDRDPSKMDGPPDLGHTLETFYAPNLRLIRSMKKPVISAINGVAAGAGANIAFACDIVVAGKSAKFIQSFGKVGLVPDAGGTWSLAHAIGPMRAKALAMTAEPLTAEMAESWGLVWKVFDDDALLDEARALTASLSNGPTVGFATTKAVIDQAINNSFETQLQVEADAQRACGRTKDYAEGVTAFLEKRAPNFTGN